MFFILAIAALTVALAGCAWDSDKERSMIKQGYEVVYHNPSTNDWLVEKGGKVYMIHNGATFLKSIERWTSVYPIDGLVPKGSFNINIK